MKNLKRTLDRSDEKGDIATRNPEDAPERWERLVIYREPS